MASLTGCDDHVQMTFDPVVREFKDKLNNDKIYAEILKTTSVDDVYRATDKLQEEQAKSGHLRHLSKISRFLELLKDYDGAMSTFVQAKPDILALIWGPIKLLLQWTSALKQSFDAIINVTADIGNLLPEFKEADILFGENPHLSEVLVLFFQDILDFYVVALKFFSLSRWRYVFESMWPKQRERIKVVMSNIEQHTGLMRGQVRREHIRQEHEARRRALEHFEKAEKSAIHDEYNAIKTHVSPVFYDDVLNRVEGRVCDGTGKWLVKDATFCKWVDATDVSTRRLWLQGIPGAGKTFLATTVIRQAMAHGRTIFAFLSHDLSRNTSALSVIHSLLFQLTLDDHSLQALLCQSTRKNLSNDLGVAAELLQRFLSCVSPVYIVIDGIDEISEVERGRLLGQLLLTAKECEGTRILISSRPEVNIKLCLDPEFDSIRIDHRNSSSIQAFVTRRAKQWFRRRDFLPEHRTNIEVLLAPLAAKTKGMFLYVEVVLNTIEYLDVQEILDELTIPPEDLDAAYFRVLKRINDMSARNAEKARNVLGWIGCSPIPLSTREMEQVLCVTEDPNRGTRVSASLDVVQLCGPIVEVVDGLVRFVHFTVKEYDEPRPASFWDMALIIIRYLFSPSICGSVDLLEATLNLTRRCIWYLCQMHHDPCIEDDEFQDNILQGDYRLHHYASTAWLELVELYARLNGSNPLSTEIIMALSSLHERRASWRLEDLSEDKCRSGLQGLKMNFPELYNLLCHAIQFRQKSAASEYHVQRSEKWGVNDPLGISDISLRLYEAFDRLPCFTRSHSKNCHCLRLGRHYGDRFFKCGVLGCPMRCHGFSTKAARDKHEKYHSRQWKCTDTSCEYSDVGFLSRRMRDEHLEFHSRGLTPRAPAALVSDKDELQPLLFDLVGSDDVEAVRPLVPGFLTLGESVRLELCKLAAFSGSVAMLELLYSGKPEIETPDVVSFDNDVISASLRGNNCDSLRWLLSLFPLHLAKEAGTQISHLPLLEGALEQESVEAFELCKQHIITNLSTPFKWSKRPPADGSIAPWIITLTARLPDREERLLDLWENLARLSASSKFLTTAVLGDGLGNIAGTTASITLARQLIKYGAHVDARRSPFYMTPLHRAARRSSAESAEFMKFLLYEGADPTMQATRSRNKIEEERGAREIQKWLGLSWDELIEKVRIDRENGIGWPGADSSSEA